MKPDMGEPPSPDTQTTASSDALPHSLVRDDKPWRPANVFVSFAHAADGVTQTFRSERNFRFHCFAATCVIAAGFVLNVSPLRFIVVLLAIAFVLVAELFNTAIEATVDLAMPESHPLAKRAKDAAAGAVLVASGVASLIGAIVFIPALIAVFGVGVSSRIVVIAGSLCAIVAVCAALFAARRKYPASGTSNDSFRRIVIGVGLVACAASTGLRMAQIVDSAFADATIIREGSPPPRPALLFPGGVP